MSLNYLRYKARRQNTHQKSKPKPISSPLPFAMKKVSCVSVTVTVTLMLLLLLPYSSEATLTCTDVFKNLQPCLNYLVNGYGKPPPACCAGASKLATAASTPADKKTACTCIKTASQNIKLNAAAAQALPGNCGISLPVTVSPTVDCSKIG